jgi:hypothetical protein
MEPVARPSLSNIPKQRAATIITPMDRSIVQRPIAAIPIKSRVVNYRPNLPRTIAQIVRFVRRFPLRACSYF